MPNTSLDISLGEIAASLVHDDIVGKMVRGYFQRVSNPYPPIISNILTVSCVDSRLPPARVLDHQDGQAYAVQTVANVVPDIDFSQPLEDQPTEVAAALQYGVEHKGVREVLVLGHTHCGGAEARFIQNPSFPNIKKWMRHVCIEGLNEAPSAETLAACNHFPFLRRAALRDVERECLKSSITNIKKLPFMAEALKDKLSLAGLMCDLDEGKLEINYGNSSALNAIKDLIDRFKRFKQNEWGPDGRMHDLVANGQHPKALLITGISPYVAPENVFGINPGDAFIHRRLGGNYHHERTPGGLAATIEFAVAVKQVSTLVIVAHRNDVNRDYAEGLMDRYNLVTSFMEKATPELRQWRDSGMHPDRMHENSLRSTYFNAMQHPAVNAALQAGKLSVVALLVDHEHKYMEYYDPRRDRFLKVKPPA